LVDGAAGLALAPKGRLRRALRFTIANGRIVEAGFIVKAARLQDLDLAVLSG
jgi:RNA polymerase sigma-70 factor (ECF subfamily)